MLTFLAKRLLQLIPTVFFVSVLIFSLQQLLPGDPALIMAGEDRDPEVIEQIRKQYRLDQPIPVQYALLDEGRAHRRSWRVDALQAAGARSRAAEVPRDDAACRDGLHHRDLDRDHGRHRIGGAEGHRVGLRRQRVRAVGAVHAELLARHHADLPVLGAARLAAAVGLCAADGGLEAKPAHHHHAGLRARQRARRRADAPHPQRHAAGVEQRLRAHRARQGAARALRRSSSMRCAMR